MSGLDAKDTPSRFRSTDWRSPSELGQSGDMTSNLRPQNASTTTSTGATPSTTTPQAGAPTSPAWHDRASGEVSSWGATYNPTSEAAARSWRAHRDHVEPWIAATGPAGVTEARRVASAVLELLAWAMPQHNDLMTCMTEETLQQFIEANPTHLSVGALANVRGRVRRVFRVLAQGSGEGHAVPDTAPETIADIDAPDPRQRETANPGEQPPANGVARERAAAAEATYDHHDWSRLIKAAATDQILAGLVRTPWTPPSQEAWTHAQSVGQRLGIELRQQRLRRTLHQHALISTGQPLGAVLRDLRLSREAATDVARLLPNPSAGEYADFLRGEAPKSTDVCGADHVSRGHCTDTEPTHCGSRPGPRAGVRPQQVPQTSGDALPMSTSTQESTATLRSESPDHVATPRRRKPSARQARLARTAVRAETAQRAASLPDSIRGYIRDTYRPLPPVLEHWDHLKEAVEATLAASSVRGEDSMRKHVTHLAYFFAWAHASDLPLAPSTLTRGNVGRYELEALAASGRSTVQTRRSRLSKMADQIHPDQAPVKGPPLAHRAVAAPYSPAEMAIVRRVAQVQPTPLLTRQVCLLVGLGAGAGIDSTDLKRLHRHDVTDHGPEGGIEIKVTNLRRSGDNSRTERCRTVWVLREYEDLVRTGLQGLTSQALLLGRDAERANVAARIIERAALYGDVPTLSQGRLRSTWLAAHLRRTTPLNVLMRAAGLTTARTLVDLLPHLPDEDDGGRWLR